MPSRDISHEWLRDAYAQVRITDSHFLYMRGIPFFPTFLENSLPILKANLPIEAIVQWYGVLSGQLDEEGEARLGQWMQPLMVTAAGLNLRLLLTSYCGVGSVAARRVFRPGKKPY